MTHGLADHRRGPLLGAMLRPARMQVNAGGRPVAPVVFHLPNSGSPRGTRYTTLSDAMPDRSPLTG